MNSTYNKNVTYNNIFKNMPNYNNVSNMITYSFTISGIDYVVIRYVSKGMLEIHFMDFSDDILSQSIPKRDAIKVFSTVLKIIYDNKRRSDVRNIRILFTNDRESIYRKIFSQVNAKYFPEYKISKDSYFYTKTADVKSEKSENIYSFDLTRQEMQTMPYSIKELKEAIILNKTIQE
jgi:hypothetical protein